MTAPEAYLALALSCAVLSGLGCSGAHQAAVEIGPAGPEVLPVEDAGRLEKAPPAGPGCTWTGSLLTPRGEDLALCFAVDGACFAQVGPALLDKVVVTLPEGKPAEKGARVEIIDEGIRLAAWTAGDDVLLFASRPVSFGPSVVWLGGAPMFIEHVHGGTVDLSFRGDESIKLRTGPLRARAACTDLALRSDAWSPAELLAAAGISRGGASKRLLVPMDQPIAVSTTPGGAAALDVIATSEELSVVEEIERRGDLSRVLFWRPEAGVVIGWVDGSAFPVVPSPDVGAPGPGGLGGGPRQPLLGTSCPLDIPLFAQVAGTTAEAGTIIAKTRFDVGRVETMEYTKIRIRARRFDSLPDSIWLARTVDLQGCKVE